jgi:hypothetical protein
VGTMALVLFILGLIWGAIASILTIAALLAGGGNAEGIAIIYAPAVFLITTAVAAEIIAVGQVVIVYLT